MGLGGWVSRTQAGWATAPASTSGNPAPAHPLARPHAPGPAGGGSSADGLLAAAAAAARLSALLADGPPALRAHGSPLPAACSPVPWARGGGASGSAPWLPPPSLAAPSPRGPGPGRPPEGEGEGTSALFVTTESIVCEEPAPAGDGAERGAGGPDGGGARRGERGSEGGREAGAGRPRSLARAGRGRGGSEGGWEGSRPGRAGPGAERTNGGSPRRKVQSSAAPREQPPPQPPPAAEQ